MFYINMLLRNMSRISAKSEIESEKTEKYLVLKKKCTALYLNAETVVETTCLSLLRLSLQYSIDELEWLQ